MTAQYHRRTTGGRFPRLTQSERDDLHRPVDHQVIFDATAGRYSFYDAATDQTITGDGAASLDFTASTQKISGEDFATEGFFVGQWVNVSDAANAANNGKFQVTAVDASSITVARGETSLVDESNVAATVDGEHGWRDHTGDQPSEL